MSHSSTSSSDLDGRGRGWLSGGEPPRWRDRLHSTRIVLGMAVAVLLVCELTARALATQLPPHEGWGVRDFEWQVARIKERSETEETCLVFLGSSAVGAGVHPDVLTPALGHDHWYIAWLAGTTARLLEPWSREMVQPMLSPQFVVIGVTSYELNDAYTGVNGLLDSYLSSPGRHRVIGETSLAYEVESIGARLSALVALRPYLRSPAELVARVTGKMDLMAPPHGQNDGHREVVFSHETANLARVRAYVRDFAVGGQETAALERIIANLQAAGVHVALADLPVLEEEWAALHERGSADIEAYRRLLHSIGDRYGIPVYSYAGMFEGARQFADWIHLNGEGAERFTTALSGDLTDWMESAGASCEA